jgi:hypothetical protein
MWKGGYLPHLGMAAVTGAILYSRRLEMMKIDFSLSNGRTNMRAWKGEM